MVNEWVNHNSDNYLIPSGLSASDVIVAESRVGIIYVGPAGKIYYTCWRNSDEHDADIMRYRKLNADEARQFIELINGGSEWMISFIGSLLWPQKNLKP